jgi:two-component system response regulator HydG
MAEKAKILIVDDDAQVLEALRQMFMSDYRCTTASSGTQAIEILKEHEDIEAVVLDIKMARMDGLQTASAFSTVRPDLPIIFHTGYPGEYSEAEIEQQFAPFDYVGKEERPERLHRAVKRAVAYHRLQDRSISLEEHAKLHFGMVGRSPAMLEVYRTIEKIAPTDRKVIVHGSTGTGKELVARALHRMSKRSSQRLVICNCTHRPPDMVDAELFGHLKGSFTGAVDDRVGLLEYADQGTLFLDEIGDLDSSTQGKLLRVLETGELQRVGSPETITVEVRLICATHRDLRELVEQRKFREDLYYRLKGVTITLIDLKDRREDILPLVDHFIQQHCSREGIALKIFEPAARDLLVHYDWPGNVRQLMDTVQSLIDLSPSYYVTREMVERYLASGKTNNLGASKSLKEQIIEYKRQLLIAALDRNGQNLRATARELSVDPSNLRKLVKELGIDNQKD